MVYLAVWQTAKTTSCHTDTHERKSAKQSNLKAVAIVELHDLSSIIHYFNLKIMRFLINIKAFFHYLEKLQMLWHINSHGTEKQLCFSSCIYLLNMLNKLQAFAWHCFAVHTKCFEKCTCKEVSLWDFVLRAHSEVKVSDVQFFGCSGSLSSDDLQINVTFSMIREFLIASGLWYDQH